MQALWSSLSGMTAGQDWLTSIAGNVANVQTPGYAQQGVSFADELTAALPPSDTAWPVAARYTPPGWRGGTGTYATQAESDFAQMPVRETGNPMDVAIDGPAFLLVRDANGRMLVTRAGNLAWSRQANGRLALTTASGQQVLDTNRQPIYAPPGAVAGMGAGQGTGGVASSLKIDANGQIHWGNLTGPTIALVDVPLPSQSLEPVGANAYALRPGWTLRAAQTGQGSGQSSLRQGALNQSNVDLTDAMSQIIEAQRLFELNAEALQLTNRMMSTADEIHL
ncbi:MAG: flagellar hook basal-body protein [Alicyclobacillus herbarius]|uniref:flagellar hook-basal body protein n=1 Tax=Alicyclobacillus herbarius TaxID=122960 RepID=UPI00041B03FC|nr:flagellar hook basal-body protein [Alicyclobacillus herbarius]MCL6631810.1 flagellar hook basal-body protein [Alicyclobacillus herbarius]